MEEYDIGGYIGDYTVLGGNGPYKEIDYQPEDLGKEGTTEWRLWLDPNEIWALLWY